MRPSLHELWWLLHLGLAVLAGFCVEAGILQAKPFYWPSAEDVGVDDLVDVGFCDMAIPDGVWIHDYVRAVLALIQAAGLIGAYSAFQAALR